MRLALSDIRTDGGTQIRSAIEYPVVQEYADAMRAGVEFPPVVAFYDGSVYWLADGFHRFKAKAEIGETHIDADVRQGTREDAVWHSCAANKAHGLPRKNPDKRRAVETALKHPKSGGLSDRAIAEHCGVSHPFVADVRRTLVTDTKAGERTGKDGHKRGVHSEARSKAGKASAEKRAAAKPAPILESDEPDEGGDADEAPIPECAPPIAPPKPTKPQPPATPPANVLNARDRIVAEAVALGPDHARWIAERILRHVGASRAA